MQRFIHRTWRRTSEEICKANEFKPGFRIVLIGEDGRVRRNDLIVMSGEFSRYPAGFTVQVFLQEIINVELDGAHGLDYDSVQLRTHRDELVAPDMTLRRVRDMTGIFVTEKSIERTEILDALEQEIEEALVLFEEDWRLADDNEILLKAIMQYIINHFSIDDLEHTIDYYKHMIEMVRRERG